jgi:hypothetical protein
MAKQRLKSLICGLWNSPSGTADPEPEVARLFQRKESYVISPSGTAATSDLATALSRVNSSTTVINAYYIPAADLAVDATSFAVLRLVKYTGNATSVPPTTLMASYSLGTSALDVGLPVALTNVAGAMDVDPGQVLAYEVTKSNGSGQILAAGKLVVTFEERYANV